MKVLLLGKEPLESALVDDPDGAATPRLSNDGLARTPSFEQFGELIGRSDSMLRLFAHLERVAKTGTSLLIEGESGTGKAAAARAVHTNSARRNGPFVVFNCDRIPTPLIHGQLFGIDPATNTPLSGPGLVEQAQGGTLFLNRVGELPMETQIELSSVLRTLQVRRLGADVSIPVDFRVIAATSYDLRSEVHRERFREDLYRQIATTRVTIPPLRDRMEDLSLLIAHLLEERNSPGAKRHLPEQVLAMFHAYHWPGNSTELAAAVRSFSSPPTPTESEDTAAPSSPVPLRTARRNAVREFEYQYLKSVLAKAGGNITRAATIARVSRQMIQRMLRKHAL